MYSNQDFRHIRLLEIWTTLQLTVYTYLGNTMLELRHSFISSIYAVLQHNKMKFMCEPKLKILILETIT